MKLRFYWIGATRDKRLASLESEYLERIRKFLASEIVSVPELKKNDPRGRTAQLTREGKNLLSQIPSSAKINVLHEKGEAFSSPQMAKWLEGQLAGGGQELSFVVGGYWGIPEEVTQKANRRISLGRMTFPHEIARVLLLEQVYRAFSINRGMPYHK